MNESEINLAALGGETQLAQMVDILRGDMDAAAYKHVVLGLIFLKYVSDVFEEQYARLEAERAQGADPEDPDEYRAVNTVWVPAEARWRHLEQQAGRPAIGRIIHDAMTAIERENPTLDGMFPKDYIRPGLDGRRLGRLIELIGGVKPGDGANRAQDVLGRVYEYFLARFAGAEGKRGGEFYTPRCVVKLLVEMLEPYRGRVYDPCCGAAGMFVQLAAFIRARAGENDGEAQANVSIYGQELNHAAWRLAKMNLAIHGLNGQIARGDTLHHDGFPNMQAEFILANPPFNVSEWGGERLREDRRWRYGAPPVSNANFAWVQHIIHHLAPNGAAGIVLPNGPMSSRKSSESEIRKNIIEADLVDCIVALPGQLFYSTQIPVCLWFLARNKQNGEFGDRRGKVLFIDAQTMGRMADRTHRELTDEDIARIVRTYHAWCGKSMAGAYKDTPGFCKSATLEEIRRHDHVLSPGRYVGAAPRTDDGEPFEEKMRRLTATLHAQQAKAAKLDAEIWKNLERVMNLGQAAGSGHDQKPLPE